MATGDGLDGTFETYLDENPGESEWYSDFIFRCNEEDEADSQAPPSPYTQHLNVMLRPIINRLTPDTRRKVLRHMQNLKNIRALGDKVSPWAQKRKFVEGLVRFGGVPQCEWDRAKEQAATEILNGGDQDVRMDADAGCNAADLFALQTANADLQMENDNLRRTVNERDKTLLETRSLLHSAVQANSSLKTQVRHLEAQIAQKKAVAAAQLNAERTRFESEKAGLRDANTRLRQVLQRLLQTLQSFPQIFQSILGEINSSLRA
mmetsp:Transcript_22425/g.77236  ORF Transcript_22425/g.77236 Transcript_22425/m.77236 type:complete len:263 (-) Transcript_22425:35-823(-)